MANQESKTRRKLLNIIVAGTGTALTAKTIPNQWTRPFVDSVLLPAHAMTSGKSEPEPECDVDEETASFTTTATDPRSGPAGTVFDTQVHFEFTQPQSQVRLLFQVVLDDEIFRSTDRDLGDMAAGKYIQHVSTDSTGLEGPAFYVVITSLFVEGCDDEPVDTVVSIFRVEG